MPESLKGAVVAAIKAELKRQGDDSRGRMPSVLDLGQCMEPPRFVSIDGDVDVEALADAFLKVAANASPRACGKCGMRAARPFGEPTA